MTNKPRSSVILLSLLIILAVSLSLTGIIDKSFYSKGEPREALVSQSMVDTGNWILPNRYGSEFATKPPFSHWIAASFAKIFKNHSETAARLPSLLMSLIALISIFIFIAREKSPDLAFLVGLFLLTTIEWHRASITSRVDMTLTAMSIVALVSLYFWERHNFKGFPIAAIFGLTGAILSKGPVGLALPISICGLHYLLEGRSFLKSSLRIATVCIPATLIAFTWYWTAYEVGGQQFLDVVLLENLARFQGTMEAGEDPHNHSIFYLYGTVLLGLMPWTICLLPQLISNIKAGLHQFAPLRHFKNSWSQFIALPRVERFSWLVVLAYLVFFSIPASKRSVYLLPIYPFLTLLLCIYVSKAPKAYQRYENVLQKLCLLIGTLLAVLIFTPLSSLLKNLAKNFISPNPSLDFYLTSIQEAGTLDQLGMPKMILIVTLLLGLVLFYKKAKFAPTPITYSAIMIFLTLAIANLSVINHIASRLSPKNWIADLAPTIEQSKLKAFTFKEKNYPLNYYMHGTLDPLETPSEISAPAWIFVATKEEEAFREVFKTYLIKLISISPNPIERPHRTYSLFKVTPN